MLVGKCRRLNLQSLEVVLQTPDIMTQRRIDIALRVLPEEWSSHVDMAREEIAWTLQTLSANALELTSLWMLQHFHEKLLVEVSSPAFLAKLPMDAMDFETVQHECHQRVKQSLWTYWLPKSAEVFRLIPPVCINGDAEAYYRCIATLQGNQLRQLVHDSIESYVKFFEQHPGISDVDPQQDTLLWSRPAIFKTQLVVGDDGQPSFKPAFHQVERLVEAVLDGAVKTTFDIPRIGTNMMVVGSLTNAGSRTSANCIPTMDLDDQLFITVWRLGHFTLRKNAYHALCWCTWCQTVRKTWPGLPS
jgi:dynein heavy chain, axonemal